MGFSPISPTPTPSIGGRRKRVMPPRSISSAHCISTAPAQASTNFAPWHRAAAERDPEAAERSRDLLFPNGFEVPQDPGEALRWSRAAAEQGSADTQANTGLIYARGVGCRTRLFREAQRWYAL